MRQNAKRSTLDHPAFVTLLGAAGLLLAAAGQSPGDRPEHARTGAAPDGSGATAPDGRGSTADKPSEIPARGWGDVLKRVKAKISDNRLMSVAAGVTFYALLSVFPALAALISLYGLIASPAAVVDQVQSLSGVLPGGGVDLITEQAKTLATSGNGGLGIGFAIGLATSVWSANQGMKALFDALNIVYEEREKRGFFKLTAMTLGATFGTILFMIVAMTAVVVLPAVLGFIGLGAVTKILLSVLRWPLLLAVIAVLLAFIYRYGPSRARSQWRWISWGSGFAAVTWVVVSVLFSWYVAHFGSYNKTYGSLGAVVGFMTWIWISTTVVLIGAQLNAELELQTSRDTTTGPERAPGRRGAVTADRMARA